MVQKKLNKKKLVAVLVAFLLIIFFIVFAILLGKKKNSLGYKLETIGYSEAEIAYIKDNFNETEITKILDMEYEDSLVNLKKEKYFRFDKLKEYLDFYKMTKNVSFEEVIRRVNTNATVDFYDNILETDTTKNELMIVNKVYKLSEDYVPEELVKISSRYAYSDKYISNSILQNVIDLIDSASENNIKLIVSQGYRSYESQESAYNNYKSNYGIRQADNVVARPGHSDYQTGLSLIIEPYQKPENIEESEEYIWLMNNAHNYGFIQRYGKDKEAITGFNYEPWRLRYVGVDAASQIYEEGITFEEYYGYRF